MIAGPNGAGKTTFYESFLASLPLPFVNADQIARTLAPDDPASIAYGAAEVADRERRELLALRRSFIMETVFSDPAGDKLAFLRAAQTAGYAVILLFVGIVSPSSRSSASRNARSKAVTTSRRTSCSSASRERSATSQRHWASSTLH